jgi:NADH-quinone oxidoreductase subunit C
MSDDKGNNGNLKDAISGLEAGPESTPGGADNPFGGGSTEQKHPTVDALRAKFSGAVQHHTVVAGDEHVVYIPADRNVEILRWLATDASQLYDLLADLTAVDFGGGRPLEVVYQLWSIPFKRALRVKTLLPLNDLDIETVEPIWKTADWLEREVFDLFGINFTGHPDMRRILMPENYAEGHPLRKDFPLRGRFTRAEQTRRALSMSFDDYYTPEELSIVERNAASRNVDARDSEPLDEATFASGDVPHPDAVDNTDNLPGRPNDVNYSLGTSGSAAGGAPSPGGV